MAAMFLLHLETPRLIFRLDVRRDRIVDLIIYRCAVYRHGAG